MEFFHGVVALLAGLVLVLSGLVVWIYIQQSRQQQAISSIAIALTTPPVGYPSAEEVVQSQEEAVDDRVTVEDTAEEDDEDFEIAGQEDISDLKAKTVTQLREMLTKRGIPSNKSDKKSTLISLLQAAS